MVYLITDGNYYKIGVSTDPESRLKSLQTGNPNKLEIVNTYNVSSSDMYEMETTLHNMFKDKRVLNEWFDLEYSDIEDIKTLTGKPNSRKESKLSIVDCWKNAKGSTQIKIERILCSKVSKSTLDSIIPRGFIMYENEVKELVSKLEKIKE